MHFQNRDQKHETRIFLMHFQNRDQKHETRIFLISMGQNKPDNIHNCVDLTAFCSQNNPMRLDNVG